ncbi:hypothetical protein [Chenggangzhangella methanolivorans]|uniref:Uncharacterized protein n=2 Tax=Chenggangzhangella methanolivorans TaxID=1437009 RepID=A0A9E6REC5_9HYPH|nr:hypothetical protein [Chenggangzhangella methanolivorans]QZN99645.1 hypothetical protein K6K41_23595 [Chenggangzhangella methanolivorans]
MPGMADVPKHPAHGWGPYAADPWSDDLDGAAGPDSGAWAAAVEEARRLRLALQSRVADKKGPREDGA